MTWVSHVMVIGLEACLMDRFSTFLHKSPFRVGTTSKYDNKNVVVAIRINIVKNGQLF